MLRSDAGFALIAGLLCHAHGIKGADGRRLGQKDFMPYPVAEDSGNCVSPEQMLMAFKSFSAKTKAFNKRKQSHGQP